MVRNIFLAAARRISRPWLAISAAAEISLRLAIPTPRVRRHSLASMNEKGPLRGSFS